ncbi:hypothetical protein [Agrobacterium tumefaciens]|uniref:hypothetical protein n=1 Tax=Agrobacterium tumefaciens TaxID=358 RepID=UPI0011785260
MEIPSGYTRERAMLWAIWIWIGGSTSVFFEMLENDRLVGIVENLRDQSLPYGLRALSEQGGW